MSALRVAVTVITVAATVARHPVVRAGIKAAPLLATPAMRQAAADTARNAAFSAGVLARRIVKGR
jgi:hypothetical protein